MTDLLQLFTVAIAVGLFAGGLACIHKSVDTIADRFFLMIEGMIKRWT